ncbi:hypothetical protein BH20ACT6_BH20ACT6_17660 [soil metagenome]
MSQYGQPADPHGRPFDSGTQPNTQPDPHGTSAPPPPPQWQPGQPQPGSYQPGCAPQGRLGTTSEERNWAMAAHLGSFVAAYAALGLLAPLLVMITKGNESGFVRRHAVESLNFQLSVLVYSVVGGIAAVVLTIGTLGLGLIVLVPLIAVFLLAYAVLVVVGTVKASQGEDFRYPLTVRLVS